MSLNLDHDNYRSGIDNNDDNMSMSMKSTFYISSDTSPFILNFMKSNCTFDYVIILFLITSLCVFKEYLNARRMQNLKSISSSRKQSRSEVSSPGTSPSINFTTKQQRLKRKLNDTFLYGTTLVLGYLAMLG